MANASDDFAARYEAGRRFERTVSGVTVHFRRPDEHTVRNAYEANRRVVDGQEVFLESRAARDILDTAIIGWSGLMQTAIEPAADPGAEIPFSVENRKLFLNARQDIADVLANIVLIDFNERRGVIEASVKKSEQ